MQVKEIPQHLITMELGGGGEGGKGGGGRGRGGGGGM